MPMRSFVRMLLRRLTSRLRALPDFLIMGAQKGGTSSLYYYLVSHPWVLGATTKEIHYFPPSPNHRFGPSWYRAHFPLMIRYWLRQVLFSEGTITGEATPLLSHPEAPSAVHALLPRVKLVALLRNPVDRAFSHYHHEQTRGRESRAFAAVVTRDPAGQVAEFIRFLATARQERPRPRSYLYRGLYAEHLLRWLKHFGRDQILVLNSEHLFSDPQSSHDRVLKFLDLPLSTFVNSAPRNVGDYSASIERTTRQRLLEYYRPHNERLYELLGDKFDWDH